MSEIQKFYENSTVLITGGTGFVGKLLVEKLVRSCQNVYQVFLMMRNKNGLSAQQRMDKYFEDQVFSRLKLENPDYSKKVRVIQGDIDCINLNLSPEDEELLINSVNIIFHAAATINFTEKLRSAVNTNVHGIRKVMELAKRMKHLKSFVHVSTVYSNCHLDVIDEKIYNNEITYHDIIRLLSKYNDEELEKMTPSLIGKAPNTYTFTKALAEKFIAENCQNLPIGIFRPAIVISTANEPISGWIDNFYGPTGLIASATRGIFHIMHGRSEVFSNIVPADMVVNAIIATGWDVGQKCKKLPIYNFVSTQNPLSWGEYIEMCKLGLDYPFSNSIWYMSLSFVRQKWLYEIFKLLLHTIPAYILDVILRVMRKKPLTYEKLHSFVKVLSYFTNKNWEYVNGNVLDLWDRMSEEDKILFNFDMSTINWDEYFKYYIKGIRVYLFKDELSTLESARIKYTRLYWMHHFCKYSCYMLLTYIFCRGLR